MSDDVVVIGAGPAGTAAAIRCALAGVKVVLLERAAFPRHRPGETLHPGVEPLLRQLGVWEQIERTGFVRHMGIRVRFPGIEQSVSEFGSDANGPWLGLQAWRAEFDQILLDRAVELGVRVLQPCAVECVVVDNGVVTGVGSDEGCIEADFVIDAAGGRHWLMKELKIPMRTESPPLVARYGYVEGNYPAARDIPMLTADAEGWTWIARVREQTYQWTRLASHQFPSRQRPSDRRASNLQDPHHQAEERIQATRSDLPTELRHLTSSGHVCGADVTWRCASIPAGPGYFLCGDAAAVLDPASSHGVLKALMTGIYAGHLIEQIQTGLTSATVAAAEYSDWLIRWFQHDVVELRKHYSHMGLAALVGS